MAEHSPNTQKNRPVQNYIGPGGKAPLLSHFEWEDTTELMHARPQSVIDVDLPALTAARPILINEDAHEVLHLFTLGLEKVHLTVIGTFRSADALRVCRERPISLVMSGLAVPDMSGVDLLAHLRHDPVNHDIPFVLLTASHRSERIEQARHLDVDGVWEKPILMTDLIHRVQQMLLLRGNWQRRADA
jgi:CheY-like chemotaxis protein